MELSEFLLARFAEDEAAAQAAMRKSSYGWSDNAFTEAVELAEGEGAVKEATTHIARWDPARVLAKCAADRQIVALAEEAESLDYAEWAERGLSTDPGYNDPRCGERILQALALPYADHPDYDEAWRG